MSLSYLFIICSVHGKRYYYTIKTNISTAIFNAGARHIAVQLKNDLFICQLSEAKGLKILRFAQNDKRQFPKKSNEQISFTRLS